MSPLRADAERTVHAILAAAERVLSTDPGASMEQIAEQAGVSRTTVHRRFATREALVEALAASAAGQIEQAVSAARPRTAPPLVALHQATANILAAKSAWRFAVTQISPGSPAASIQQRVIAQGDLILRRLQDAALISPGTDLGWARLVYSALLVAATSPDETDTDPDLLAARIVDTLLHGLSAPPASRPGAYPAAASVT